MEEDLVLVRRQPPIAVVTLNRPDALNALSLRMKRAVEDAIDALEADDEVRAIVLAGSERAFAAGADIAEMADMSAVDMMEHDAERSWQRLRAARKPIIAAVRGYALGGGCELALLCDMIIAGESAQFGQPEVKIGIIPGVGGTQFLTRALGKWRAMEMVLTGRRLGAQELDDLGLVTRVVPDDGVLLEAERLAREIAKMPPIAVRLAKEAVQRAFLGTLDEGLAVERKNFYLLFATEDRAEGMQAFLEKRPPQFTGK